MKLVFHIETRADAEFAAAATQSVLSAFPGAPHPARTRARTKPETTAVVEAQSEAGQCT